MPKAIAGLQASASGAFAGYCRGAYPVRALWHRESRSVIWSVFNDVNGDYPMRKSEAFEIGLPAGKVKITAMRFSVTPEEFPYQPGDILDLAVTLERNEYRGEASLSIHIRDLKLHGVDEAALLQEQALYEGARRGEGLSDDKTEKLLPNREQFAVVYRYLREQKGWNYSLDVYIFV
mgnify:CR=1 FL=1